jgi:uncharacterized protein YraI
MASGATAAAAVATATTDLNVRECPGTQCRVIGQLSAGQRVDGGPCDGGWCALASGGYASQRYLAFGVAEEYYPYEDYAYAYGYDPYFYYGPTIGFWYGTGPRYYRDRRFRDRRVYRDSRERQGVARPSRRADVTVPRTPRVGTGPRPPRAAARGSSPRATMRSGAPRIGPRAGAPRFAGRGGGPRVGAFGGGRGAIGRGGGRGRS